LKTAGSSFQPTRTRPKTRRLVIVKAVYGVLPNGKTTDVTADLADMVENDGLELAVGNNTLGDPAFGKVKKLRVDYKFDGWKKSITRSGKRQRIENHPPSIELAEIHKRIFFRALWIVSGILAVSAVVAACGAAHKKMEEMRHGSRQAPRTVRLRRENHCLLIRVKKFLIWFVIRRVIGSPLYGNCFETDSILETGRQWPAGCQKRTKSQVISEPATFRGQ
jgi:hypothetical protein